MRRVSTFLIALLVLLILVGVAVVSVYYLHPQGPMVTLPNGMTLRCLGATYGTNNVPPSPRPWLGLLPRPVRSWVEGRLRIWTKDAKSIDTVGSTECWVEHQLRISNPGWAFRPKSKIVVWFAVSRPATTSTNAYSRYPVPIHAVLLDANGHTGGWESSFLAKPGPRLSVQPISFPGYPRRSARFFIRLFIRNWTGTTNLLAELPLRNPQPWNQADWPAAAFPARETNGPLSVALVDIQDGSRLAPFLELESGGSEEVASRAAGPFAPPHTAMVFDLTTEGRPAIGWEIAELSVGDQAGNVFSRLLSVGTSAGARRFWNTSPSLWPNETWQVTVWAKRKDLSHLPPDDLVELKDIPLPAINATRRIHRLRHCGGVTFPTVSFVRKPPFTGNGHNFARLSQLGMNVTHLLRGESVVVGRVRDERGRPLEVCSYRYTDFIDGQQTLDFGFRDIPVDARTISLTVGVQRERKFVFRVKPHLLRTNAPEVVVPAPAQKRP